MSRRLLFLFPALGLAVYLLTSLAPAPLLMPLKVASAIVVILFLPGIYWAPLFCQGEKHSNLHLLISAFPLSLLTTGIATTALKLLGLAITTSNLLGVILFLSLIGLALSWKRYALMTLRDDLTPLAIPLSLAIILCIGIFMLFHHYFTCESATYWSLDEGEGITGGDISKWSFPEGNSTVTFHYAGTITQEAPRSVWLTGDRALIVLQNPSAKAQPYHLHLLLQHTASVTVELILNGDSLQTYTLRKFIPLTCETIIPLVFRQGIEENLLLRPGRNEVSLQFSQGAIPAPSASLYLENLSGMPKPVFADYMNTHHQLIRLGPLYDAMEALDFATNLKAKPFLYTWDLRSGLPGYTTANQPLEFYTDMLALVLIGPGLSSIKLLYLGKLLFLFLVIVALLKIENEDFSPRATLFYLPVLFAQACILVNFRHVEAADTLLSINFLLMYYYLRRGEQMLFIIAAFFTAITRNQGILLVVLCTASYAIIYRDILACVRRFSFFMALIIAYAAIVLLIGYTQGLLGYWKQDLFFENFYRFNSNFNYSWRTQFDFVTFNGWLLLASCGYPLLLFLRKDRFSWGLLLSIIPYYFIICHSAYMKVYYTVLLANVLNVVVLRSWMQLGNIRLKLACQRQPYYSVGLKAALGWGLGCLASLFIAISLILPPTDPDFNSRFPSLTNKLFARKIVAPYKGLY